MSNTGLAGDHWALAILLPVLVYLHGSTSLSCANLLWSFFRHIYVWVPSTWTVNRHLHVLQHYDLCRGKYFWKKLNLCSFISHFPIHDSSFTTLSFVGLQCKCQYWIWKLQEKENDLDNFLKENSLQNTSIHANVILLAMTACIIKNTGLQVRITEASVLHPCSVTLNNQLLWLSQLDRGLNSSRLVS